MRHVIVFALSVGLLSSSAAARQTGGTTAKPATKACSLLTKELAMKVSPSPNKAMFTIPPEESSLGKSGSACEYADITLQIDPFSPALIASESKKDKSWVQVPGVGDSAWFHDQKNGNAEFMASVGTRTFTIQMGIPAKSTAETIKPNVIALANAIVPKLK